MTNAIRPFARYIYTNNNQFLLNLPFGRQMRLGDLFTIRGGKISKAYHGNLDELGVEVVTETDEATDDDTWAGEHGVSFESGVEAKIPGTETTPPVSAKLRANFERAGGFLFQPKGVRYDRIKNIITVENAAREKLSKQLLGLVTSPWLITEIVVASRYTLAIAQSDNSVWEVGANVDFALGQADLVNVELGLKVTKQSKMEISKLGEGPATLFFRARKLKIKRRALGEGVKLGARAMREDGLELAAVVEKPGRDLVQWEDVSLEDMDAVLGGAE